MATAQILARGTATPWIRRGRKLRRSACATGELCCQGSSTPITTLRQSKPIDLTEILRAYTVGGATALGVEAEFRSLTIGKRADLAHLAVDPYSVEPEELAGIEIKRHLGEG